MLQIRICSVELIHQIKVSGKGGRLLFVDYHFSNPFPLRVKFSYLALKPIIGPGHWGFNEGLSQAAFLSIFVFSWTLEMSSVTAQLQFQVLLKVLHLSKYSPNVEECYCFTYLIWDVLGADMCVVVHVSRQQWRKIRERLKTVIMRSKMCNL